MGVLFDRPEFLPADAQLTDNCADCTGLQILMAQSGIGVDRPVAGLRHFRCEPLPRRDTSSQPSSWSLRASSAYFILQPAPGHRCITGHRE